MWMCDSSLRENLVLISYYACVRWYEMMHRAIWHDREMWCNAMRCDGYIDIDIAFWMLCSLSSVLGAWCFERDNQVIRRSGIYHIIPKPSLDQRHYKPFISMIFIEYSLCVEFIYTNSNSYSCWEIKNQESRIKKAILILIRFLTFPFIFRSECDLIIIVMSLSLSLPLIILSPSLFHNYKSINLNTLQIRSIFLDRY